MSVSNNKKVLISGASFAGLSTAYWMNKMGYQVTIVEVAEGLKKGGTPVNILGPTIDAVKQMGLFEKIVSRKLTMQSIEFKTADDVVQRRDFIQQHHEDIGQVEYEIERDELLQMIYDLIKDEVKFIFGDSITGLQEREEGIKATFKQRSPKTFDLIFGCDGIHSAVRRLWFGAEADFSHFLKTYFSITIVDKLLIPEFTSQMYNEPDKTVMMHAYNGKTDICLAFYSEQEIEYDYRNEQQQRNIIMNQFGKTGWRTPELLKEVQNSNSFYFDKLCQMKMRSWTKGRVALVGDAGYCASPAAGKGGSLAIDGAAALADAFRNCNGNYDLAFSSYNQRFRPYVEEVQADAVDFGLKFLILNTEEDIRRRNKEGFSF